MFEILLASAIALGAGIFLGMRLQLAKGRLAELRRGLVQYQSAESHHGLFVETLNQRTAFETAGLANHVRIVNTIQFILLWNWDLRTLLDMLGTVREEWSVESMWRRKFLARALALTAYENLTKLEQLLDPTQNRKHSLRRALRALKLEQHLAQHLDPIHQKTCAVLTRHEVLLTGIRNNVIGHRDQDAATQLLWLKQADAKEIETPGYELLALSTETLGALHAVIEHLTSQQVQIVPGAAT